MIKGSLNWNGDRSYQQIVDAGWSGIRRATEFYLQTLKTLVNTPNTGTRKKRVRTTAGGAKGSTYTVYDHPSKPGEYPRKVTGHGQAGLKREYDEKALASRVGVMANVKYMATLELFRNRKLLMATLKDYWDQLATLAGAG